MKKQVILKAQGIHKSFYFPTTVCVLKNLHLEVERGESLAIMGKSGEGKSTLLHILGTLEAPCQGTLELCGKPISSSSLPMLRNEHIGFVFQSFHLLEDYTTLENVLMPAKIARKRTDKNSSSYHRAIELLEHVGLSMRAHFPAKLLSGGEKQRAALARALCNDPDLILADEPSGNLDHANSQALYSLLLQSVHLFKKTLIVVTHDLSLASRCKRTLFLKEGILTTMEKESSICTS